MRRVPRILLRKGLAIIAKIMGVFEKVIALLFLVMVAKAHLDLGDREKMTLGVKATFEDIIKPDVDKASYRVVTLSNDIKALMISDPLCDKASAAVDVGVGTLV